MKNNTKIKVEGREIEITHPDKILWPEEKYTRWDLVEYYFSVSKYILPHLKNRPFVLNRFPEGIDSPSFYQKNSSEQFPSWIRRYKYKNVEYVMCQDLATLIYLTHLSCIEMNPWLSRIESIENPDFIILDLDPVDVGFEEVAKVALSVQNFLDKINTFSLCKTSGKRGLHVHIPVKPIYSYSQSQIFAQILAEKIHTLWPEITSLERSPLKRKKKIYLDYLQNSIGKTVVSPYSARPVPGAMVSAPIDKNELKENLDPTLFNIKTMPKRLEKYGDLFLPVLKKKNDVKKSLTSLDSLK